MTFALVLAILFGCGEATPIRNLPAFDSALIHYRSFGVFAHLPYGDSQLEKYADLVIKIDGPVKLNKLMMLLPAKCVSLPAKSKVSDLYLMVKFFHGEEEVAREIYSRFAFMPAGTEVICALVESDIEKIEAGIRELEG